MAIDKVKLRRLMELNNKRADKYLVDFANDIYNEINKSQNNDDILENLDLLEVFVYKVPKETIEIISYILHKQPAAPSISKTPFGEFEEKSHKDLILKCIDLLRHLRYILPDETLSMIAQFSLNKDADIKNNAIEVVRKISKYDYNVLTKSKIGYSIQRIVLDTISAWSREEQLKHIDFVEAAATELLSSSIEGSTNSLNEQAQYQITMHFGVVQPTDYLKKIRRDTIDLIFELYKKSTLPQVRIRLVRLLDETQRTPSNIAYKDDVEEMITEDLKYLIGIYRKMVYGDQDNEIIGDLGIVAEIEEKLYWVTRRSNKKVEEANKLLAELRSNESYSLFRLLAGDPHNLYEVDEWGEAEKKRNEKIEHLIKSISDDQIKDWFIKFDKVANQVLLVEEWKFAPFKNLLVRLAQEKPLVADKLLEIILSSNSLLRQFIGNFLDGFRFTLNFGLWDKYVERIIDSKDVKLINSVLFSLTLPWTKEGLDKTVREVDLDFFEKISTKEGKFSFLSEKEDRLFHYAFFVALTRNFKYCPKRVEPLVISEIEKNPRYLSMYFSEFSTALLRNWIEIKDLQPKAVKILTEKMAKLADLDWHTQGMLLAVGKQYGLGAVMDVFMSRVQKESQIREKGWKIPRDRYDSIPDHFHKDLTDFIVSHPEYIKIASGWVTNMTPEWSLYDCHIGEFLQKIGGNFNKIILSIIEKGDDDSLLKAARAINSINGANFDLCMEIVKRTDNKKVIDQIRSNIYSTGVVSGEYGIAEAYERKAASLENYRNSDNSRAKKFAKQMINDFLESAKRERQEADKKKQLRKMEFED